MASRYSRLYTLDSNLYVPQLPVVIVAGALSKDSLNDSVFVQLKIRNISNKHIKALKVKIYPRDTADRSLGKEIDYQYLDLDISRNQEWGQKVAIYLPDNSTRYFSVRITEIVFDDNSIWEDDGNIDNTYEALPTPEALESFFKDSELLKQYKIEVGNNSHYVAQKLSGLWRCTCGNLNWEDEAKCHTCHKVFADQIAALDVENLDKKKTARWECERKRAEEERILAEKKAEEERALAEKQAEEKRILAEKQKKIRIKNLSIVTVMTIISVSIYLFVIMYYIPEQKHKLAEQKYKLVEQKLSEGSYEEAYIMIKQLEKYSDNLEQLEKLLCEHVDIAIKYADEGDIIKYGAYEQDGDETNGKEMIEWIILKKYENQAFLVSKQILDMQPYNDWTDREVAWKKSSLNKWLNDYFKEEAFSQEESKLLNRDITLLSKADAEKYFDSEKDRAATATQYAINQKVKISGDSTSGSYWLSESSISRNGMPIETLYVSRIGEIEYILVTPLDIGVRPAIWIKYKQTESQ